MKIFKRVLIVMLCKINMKFGTISEKLINMQHTLSFLFIINTVFINIIALVFEIVRYV